jgi:class 3 adenylate cyclase
MANPDISIEDRVVLFIDVHDFSIAFAPLAEDFHGFLLLQEMYETLGAIVVEYEGEIVKYLGDGMLCVFSPGSENEVVACSLKLRGAFSELIKRRGLPSSTELEIGIGSGRVAIGVFGHASLRQKDVFGEEVNRAAMIGHYQGIAITEPVYDKVRTNHKTRRLPDFSVKWQEEPLKIWEVVE